MVILKSKAGKTIAKWYLLLVLIALIFTMVAIRKSAFAGLYIMLLTMPWSLMTTALLDKLHIQDSVPIVLKIGLLLCEAFVNAWILYWLGAAIEKTEMGGRDKWTQL